MSYLCCVFGMVRVPWVPSPRLVVEYVLDVLGVGFGDVVLDLGCGDGRFLIAAAKRGAKAICIEVDRVLCNVVEIAVTIAGVSDRVVVLCRDFFDVDLRSVLPRPTIVYAYLYSSVLSELAPKLEKELDIGTLVITLDFAIRGWSPFFVKHLIDEYGHNRLLWLYIVGISNPSARYAGLSREYIAIAEKLHGKRFGLEIA